jgi:hypothetical protein
VLGSRRQLAHFSGTVWRSQRDCPVLRSGGRARRYSPRDSVLSWLRFCRYSLGSVPGTSCTRERYDMPTIATAHPGCSLASNSTHSTAAKWVQRAIMTVTQVEEAVRPLLCRLVPLLFLPRRCGHQIWESGARMPLPMHQCPRVRLGSALRGLERLERDRLGHADPLMRLAGSSMKDGRRRRPGCRDP